MGDTANFTASELPKIRNAQALGFLNAAFGYLTLAAASFEMSGQEQHAMVADRILDTMQKLLKQVSK